MPVKPKPNEFQIIREYDAPLKAVWDAWTDPNQVAKWWGPRGFTITTHSKDLRPGGHWKYTMHGPDGTNYENYTIYHEVVDRAKLVYDHGGAEDRPPLFRVTALFSEKKGKTTLDMTMALESEAARKEIQKFIKQASGNSTWDRLGEYLEKETKGKEQFIINRSFNAPIETIFDMWTKPEHFAKWLPPTGMQMEFIRIDLKPGGHGFYKMFNDQFTMYGRVDYLEIEKPHRLVYTQQFCDEKENVSRHPMVPVWPAKMLTTVTLTSEYPDQTRVTVAWEPTGPTKPEEIEVFVKMRPSMTGGWTGSFDKLEELLAKG